MTSSEIVGSAGTPLAVARALKLAGWLEVAGSQALWSKAGCTPLAWEDVLIVIACQPMAAAPAHRPGWKTSEFRLVLLVVLPSLTAGISVLMGALPAIDEAHRGIVGTSLMALSAVLSGIYAQIRQQKKSDDTAGDDNAPKDVG